MASKRYPLTDSPLKIAQISPYYHPSVGGVEKVVQMISESLARRGHDVSVLTSTRIHGRDLPGRVPGEDRVNGVRVLRFKSLVDVGHMCVLPDIMSLLRRAGHHIIHAHVYRHPNLELALWATRNRPRPIILTGHGPFFSAAVSGRGKSFLYRLYDRTRGPTVLRRLNAVIALTRFEKAKYRRLGCPPEKIRVVPNPVEEDCFVPVSPLPFISEHGLEDKRVILFLGSLCWSKRPDLLMDALPAIVRRVPNAMALFVGPDEGMEALMRSRGQRLGIGDHFRFLGPLTGRAKHQALASANLLVLPSDGESFGIVIIEAMAHGKPVVATDAVGPREIIESGTTGLIVPRGRADRLAEAILEVLCDPGKARQMGIEAKRTATEQYHIEKVVDRIEALYYELILEPSARGTVER